MRAAVSSAITGRKPDRAMGKTLYRGAWKVADGGLDICAFSAAT